MAYNTTTICCQLFLMTEGKELKENADFKFSTNSHRHSGNFCTTERERPLLPWSLVIKKLKILKILKIFNKNFGLNGAEELKYSKDGRTTKS